MSTSNQQINREFEERAVLEQAGQVGMAYINLSNFKINPDTLGIITREEAQEYRVIPFSRQGNLVRVAVVAKSAALMEFLKTTEKSKRVKIEVFACSKTSLEESFALYDSKFLNRKKVETDHDFDENKVRTLESVEASFGEIQEKIIHVTSEEALNEIVLLSLKLRASDIHIQPYEDTFYLRFRIDGILHNIFSLDTNTANQVISRIKYLARMISNIVGKPQDGRFNYEVNGREIDLRISLLPTEKYESVVMRILDSHRKIMELQDLGLMDNHISQIKSLLHQRTGMILVTGPTGSGKTTTIYSMLQILNQEERKIITLEDPVEYHLQGVTQSQINEAQDYTFSNGLKAILRHDPDTILIGEIRDYNTARLASEASQTGHFVLSSIHTNSALGGISRLKNLGMETYNISSSISAIFAQRLGRRVCSSCKREETFNLESVPSEAKERVEAFIKKNKIPENKKVYKAVGCDKCSHSGYRGQFTICEIFKIDEEVSAMVNEGATEEKVLKHITEEKAFISLQDDGLIKFFEGVTDLDEVLRVI